MRYHYARRLHNRDEVTIKSTKEVGYVLGEPEEVVTPDGKKRVIIPVQSPSQGFRRLLHDEVE